MTIEDPGSGRTHSTQWYPPGRFASAAVVLASEVFLKHYQVSFIKMTEPMNDLGQVRLKSSKLTFFGTVFVLQKTCCLRAAKA
jgi:hypothetical protein